MLHCQPLADTTLLPSPSCPPSHTPSPLRMHPRPQATSRSRECRSFRERSLSRDSWSTATTTVAHRTLRGSVVGRAWGCAAWAGPQSLALLFVPQSEKGALGIRKSTADRPLDTPPPCHAHVDSQASRPSLRQHPPPPVRAVVLLGAAASGSDIALELLGTAQWCAGSGPSMHRAHDCRGGRPGRGEMDLAKCAPGPRSVAP